MSSETCGNQWPTRWEMSPFVISSEGLVISILNSLGDSASVILSSDAAFSSEAPVASLWQTFYFEVKVQQLDGDMAIGLGLFPPEQGELPGMIDGTYGFQSDGKILSGSKEVVVVSQKWSMSEYGPDSTVGCGWIPGQRIIFFTHDGALINSFLKLQGEAAETSQLWPVVGFRCKRALVFGNFGVETEFLWENFGVMDLLSGVRCPKMFEKYHDVHNSRFRRLRALSSSSHLKRVSGERLVGFDAKENSEYEGTPSTTSALICVTRTPRRIFNKRWKSILGSAFLFKDKHTHLTRNDTTDDLLLQSDFPDLDSRFRSHDSSGESESQSNTDKGTGAVNFHVNVVNLCQEVERLEQELESLKLDLDNGSRSEFQEQADQIQAHASQLRPKCMEMIVSETSDDTRADLLKLMGRLLNLIALAQTTALKIPLYQESVVDDLDYSQWISDLRHEHANDSLKVCVDLNGDDRINESSVSVDSEESDTKEGKQQYYSLMQGAKDNIRDLLYHLRSGTERNQLNAAYTLCILILEDQLNPVRNHSFLIALKGGAISNLAFVLEKHRESSNRQLRYGVCMAMISIASGAWVDFCEQQADKDSNPMATDLNPEIAAKVFFSELPSILTACEILLREPCFCCAHGTDAASAGKYKSKILCCPMIIRDVAMAIANLCLIFHARDQMNPQSFHAIQRQSSWATTSTAPRKGAEMNTQKNGSSWTLDMASRAVPLLLEVCSEVFSDENEAVEADEVLPLLLESCRLSTFAIALLAQYPTTHQVLFDHEVLPSIVQFLQSEDFELILHSLTIIHWLTSVPVPQIATLNPAVMREGSGQSYSSSTSSGRANPESLILVGFIAAQLINLDTHQNLLSLAAQGEVLPMYIKGVLAGCFATLTALKPCQKLFSAMPSIVALLQLAKSVTSEEIFISDKEENWDENEWYPDTPLEQIPSNLYSYSSVREKRLRAMKEAVGANHSSVSSSCTYESGNFLDSGKRDPKQVVGHTLTASRREIRRKYSSSQSGKKDRLGVNILEFEESYSNRKVAARYISLIFHNLAGNNAFVSCISSQPQSNFWEMLTLLCRSQDPFVCHYSLYTAWRLTESSPDSADKLEQCSASSSLLKALEHQQALSHQLKQNTHREIILSAWRVLGNLSNASRRTRVKVLQSGVIVSAVEVLYKLYGLNEMGEPDQPTEESNHAFRDFSEEEDSLRVMLREPQEMEIEVAHQAVKSLSALVSTIAEIKQDNLSFKRPDNTTVLDYTLRWINSDVELSTWQKIVGDFVEYADQVLLIAILLLGSPHAVIQYEACQTLASITRCPFSAPLKFDISRLALRYLMQLADGERDAENPTDRFLQLQAEEVIVGLGFSEGVSDIQRCGGNVNELFNWHITMQSLDQQRLVAVVAYAALCKCWGSSFQPFDVEQDLLGMLRLCEGLDLITFPELVLKEEVPRTILLGRNLKSNQDQSPNTETSAKGGWLDEEVHQAGKSRNHSSLDSRTSTTAALMESSHSFGELRWLRRLIGCGVRAIVAYNNGDDESFRLFQPEYPPEEKDSDSRYHGALFLPHIGQNSEEWRNDVAVYLQMAFEFERRIEEGLGGWTVKLRSNDLLHETTNATSLYPGTQGLFGSLPQSCCLILDNQFPSILQQRQFLFPSQYFTSSDLECDMHDFFGKIPSVLHLADAKEFTSTFAQVIHRVISKHQLSSDSRDFSWTRSSFDRSVCSTYEGTDQSNSLINANEWHLSIHGVEGATANKQFLQAMRDSLCMFPVISSVSFTGKLMKRKPSRNRGSGLHPRSQLFGEIFRELPKTVKWCTFDSCLSERDLDLITKAFDKGRTNLQGLAIRNSLLTEEELSPLIIALAPHGGKHTIPAIALAPALKPRHCLRWLDLSGNMLMDHGCAKVLRTVSASQSFGTIEAVDLSHNRIGWAAEATLRSLIGENSLFQNSGSSVLELHLGSNGFGAVAAARMLDYLSDHVCSLKVLDLRSNSLGGERFEESLMGLVSSRTGLIECDLSLNKLSRQCGARLSNILSHSSSNQLQFLVLEGNESIGTEDLRRMDLVLSSRRHLWSESKTILRSCGTSVLSSNSSTVSFQSSHPLLNPDSDESGSALRLPYIGTSLGVPYGTDFRVAIPGGVGNESAALKQVVAESHSELVGGNFNRPRLSVLFSVPLVGVNADRKLYPFDAIAYESEMDMIKRTFEDVSRDIDVSFDFATKDRLRMDINKKCRAIHYSGHGDANFLIFEDKDRVGAGMEVGIEDLSKIVKKGLGVRFVFVSACHSEEIGRVFVAAGVPHVVCVRVHARVLDSVVRTFSCKFYRALAEGETVKEAFDIAVSEVGCEAENQFLLLPEGANHEVPIFFHRRTIPKWPPQSLKAFRNSLSDKRFAKSERDKRWKFNSHLPPLLGEFMVGRKAETYHLIQGVLHNKLVSLIGPPGIGKSRLAVTAGNYMLERDKFVDNVVYLQVEQISSVSMLIDALFATTVETSEDGITSTLLSDLPEFQKLPQSSIFTPNDPKFNKLCEVLQLRKFLLILDRCDRLVSSDTRLELFLGKLLDFVKDMRVLLTARDRPVIVTGYAPKIQILRPLLGLEAAELFLRFCKNHTRSFPVAFRPVQGEYGMIHALAEDEEIRRLNGVPQLIWIRASNISLADYTSILNRCISRVSAINRSATSEDEA